MATFRDDLRKMALLPFVGGVINFIVKFIAHLLGHRPDPNPVYGIGLMVLAACMWLGSLAFAGNSEKTWRTKYFFRTKPTDMLFTGQVAVFLNKNGIGPDDFKIVEEKTDDGRFGIVYLSDKDLD